MKRLLTIVIVLSAAPAFPQDFEASLFGGYTTPGGILHEAQGIEDLELTGGFTWGASAGFFFSPRFGVEASWTREGSALAIATAEDSAEMFDVNVDRVLGSFVLRLGGVESRIRPSVSGGVGAAFFSAPDLERETKLSLGIGAGVRWLPTGRVGARVEARYTPTYLHDASSDFCDPFGFCQGWLQQVDLSGGVVLRF